MPDYDFKTLSPTDFELLVRDLLAAEYGWKLEAFGSGQDGGVDLRGWVGGKKVVVQCKHYAGSTFADLGRSAREELPKMNKERPDRYLFATTQNLSRTQKDSLAKDLSPWLANPGDLLTQLDLNELLSRHQRVERQHFKLWLASTGMLELIVRSGLWARSEALMEDIRDRVKLYVRSPGYDRASTRLDDTHVVVLTGVPGVGKSMLAEMLLLAHWHEGWQVILISSNIDEAWDAYRPGEQQIFFYDDFLGQTDISERGNKNEDAGIVRFMDRVAKDSTKRIVMTTRSQILRQTALTREPIARGNFELRECVVEVADYRAVERAQILYNHLYFSKLPRQVLRDYVAGKHYWQVVDHPNFSPRVIEQVIKRGSQSAETLAKSLVNTLARPIDLWGTMFATVLSDAAQRVVLTLATFPVEGVDPNTLRKVARRDTRPIDFTNALRALEGTFIQIGTSPPIKETRVAYANPSVRDFVLATLDEEPEYALSLINDACSLNQILTLLRYAAATTNGGHRFPNLAAALISEQHNVANRIEELMLEGIRTANSTKYPHVEINSVLRPIAELLTLTRQLAPERSPQLLSRALSVRSQFDAYANTDILDNLNHAFIEHEKGRLDEVKTQARELICAWGDALSISEEVEKFASFVQANKPLLAPHFDPIPLLKQYAEAALRSDVDNISSNRTDEDSDSQWLDEIEGLAETIGLADELRDDIERERSNTAQHYAEEESHDFSDRSRSGYSATSRLDTHKDRAYIGEIFQQLS
ncbi:nSTAND3 domain-containing NTPase [Nonomuraea cavernae]|uniref:Restriction endonuclease type IV Mrr domain-containing protein n=1 Tax=Nonomuraea cavernae TaxID=2045107 RepID=A0A918DEW5_9ACTN|nr:restriction endonuclease [Nonomuraea cavernae]MCA2184724.1 restriction endonuclease [Nonomuraea cavernae]GGO62947.1 hypothetical protein GCM10012289_08710 [Nonomuraea cavernae]